MPRQSIHRTGRLFGILTAAAGAAWATPAFADSACCFPDGSCTVMSSAECATAGGSYHIFLDCSEVECPLGACCLTDGSCLTTSRKACEEQGGRFQGQGTECDVLSCRAACALANGTCVMASPAECTGAFSGTYQGYGVRCESLSSDIGSCCLPDGACIDVVRQQCDLQGGLFSGSGAFCADTACQSIPLTLACDNACDLPINIDLFDEAQGLRQLEQVSVSIYHIASGEITVENRSSTIESVGYVDAMTSGALELFGTLYEFHEVTTHPFGPLHPEVHPVGNGPDYADFGSTIVAQSEAIVIEDGLEFFQSLPEAPMAAGTYHFESYVSLATSGPVRLRTSNFRSEVRVLVAYEFAQFGACCLADQSCALLERSACESSGGTYLGDDVPCSAAQCVTEVLGACTYCPGALCENMTEAECTLLGGYFTEGASCSDPDFEWTFLGSCCFGPAMNECVANVTREECETYLGASFSPCEPCRGACLIPQAGGSCAQLTATQCRRNDWRFRGTCVECFIEEGYASRFGACCLTDGQSLSLTFDQCRAVGGRYHGDDTEPWQVDCSLLGDSDGFAGACCFDSSCENLIEPNCLARGGTWLGPDASCSDTDVCDTALVAQAAHGGIDLVALVMSHWGPCPVGVGCDGDLTRDGTVDFADLTIALGY